MQGASAQSRPKRRIQTPVFLDMSQAHWLLLALSQDQGPKTKHVDALRERCERAALEGFWVS